MDVSVQDHWAQWLLHRRFGGDSDLQRKALEILCSWRDRILQNAKTAPGDVLLDVGTGDGLISFGALPLVGETGRVIFSDISQDCLDHCHSLAGEMGVLDRCQFLRASADDLSALPDASVDEVTTRSVLIYVTEKQRAFHEFFRVLKPTGRVAIFEPISRYYEDTKTAWREYDTSSVQDIQAKLNALYDSIRPPEATAMVDFTATDLVLFAERAGFREVHLNFEVTVAPIEPSVWEAYWRSSPNPLVPTAEEAARQVLTDDEIERYVAHLRPLVEAGKGTHRGALAYLWALKG
jgi:ubiquinone/menaquinone biosynthesis C-methylase UbiE